MDLKPFTATYVNPGEPVTAQAWNDIVDGVDSAHAMLLATQHTVRVTLTTDAPASTVGVFAVRDGSNPIAAVPPHDGEAAYILTGLEIGAWTVLAEADGFAPVRQAIDVSDTPGQTVAMALASPLGLVPQLFGMALADVITALGAKPLKRVRDFAGEDIPPQNPGTDNASAPVFVTSPPAGSPYPADGIELVVASLPKLETAVEVPSLAGMTQDEAQRTLEGLGLVLGRADLRQSQGTT